MELNKGIENGAVQLERSVLGVLQNNSMALLVIGIGLGIVWAGVCYNKKRPQTLTIAPPSLAVLPTAAESAGLVNWLKETVVWIGEQRAKVIVCPDPGGEKSAFDLLERWHDL